MKIIYLISLFFIGVGGILMYVDETESLTFIELIITILLGPPMVCGFFKFFIILAKMSTWYTDPWK